jgi:hypothetical protein
MPALTVADYIAGEGLQQWGSPVIDPERKIPCSLATTEAINVLIRSPRDGLVYYQRVSLYDAGQESWADRGVDVAGFIGVATDGRMLFLEFIPAALPPILGDFYIADRMPRPESRGFRHKVIHDTARSAFRELAASATLRTYTQQMNAAKYIQIIERRVAQAVREFLDTNGIDTTTYEASMEKVVSDVRTLAGMATSAGSDTAATEHPTMPPARMAWKAVTQVGELLTIGAAVNGQAAVPRLLLRRAGYRAGLAPRRRRAPRFAEARRIPHSGGRTRGTR